MIPRIGPRGPQGFRGYQGSEGSEGKRGHQGSEGPIGLPGPSGVKGDASVEDISQFLIKIIEDDIDNITIIENSRDKISFVPLLETNINKKIKTITFNIEKNLNLSITTNHDIKSINITSVGSQYPFSYYEEYQSYLKNSLINFNNVFNGNRQNFDFLNFGEKIREYNFNLNLDINSHIFSGNIIYIYVIWV